jgi:DNA-binding CsgD family transcriptional regulator
MLEPLGLGPTEEEVYRSLLAEPDSSVREVAARTGLPPARVREDLARLVALRMAQRIHGRPARFRTAPPDMAITALVNERQAALDRARLAVPELLAEYHEGIAASLPRTLLEVLTGPRVGYTRFLELLAATSEELLTFERVSDGESTGAVEVEAEAPMLARGVACRAIYEPASLEVPGRLPHLRRLADLGEQARVAPRLPLKMLICDRKRAMLPITGAGDHAGPAGPATESVVLVGPSALLDGLVEIFEAYWQRSTPLWSTGRREVGGTGLSEEEYEVLQLLAAGLKDEAIARQLGISMRTARRRISSLITTLGVGTRFQAGVEAARRDLL